MLVLSACEPTSPSGGPDQLFTVSGLVLEEVESLHYVDVVGIITLDHRSGIGGADAKVRFYSDGYVTLIDTVEIVIGDDVESVGDRQEFSIGSLDVYLLPAVGGEEQVCASFSAMSTNYPESDDASGNVGCLFGE